MSKKLFSTYPDEIRNFFAAMEANVARAGPIRPASDRPYPTR